jgi:hypothetical protein
MRPFSYSFSYSSSSSSSTVRLAGDYGPYLGRPGENHPAVSRALQENAFLEDEGDDEGRVRFSFALPTDFLLHNRSS